jgi:hypothetical protein
MTTMKTPQPSSLESRRPFPSSRLGVGANDKKKTTTATSSLIEASARLLQVGKRKRRPEEDDDGEEVDDKDDEDEGRTAIADNSIAVDRQELTAKAENIHKQQVTKKKKKNDKKQRLGLAAAAAAANGSEMIPIQAVNGDSVEQELTEPDKTGPTSTAEASNFQGRKRTKKRSRQKNIYKDTRPMHGKPLHLQLGTSQFQGRPMTAETRAKLNIPLTLEKKKTKTTLKAMSALRQPEKLAVEDWLVLQDNQSDNEKQVKMIDGHNEAAKQTHSSRRRRKPKYKNLVHA